MSDGAPRAYPATIDAVSVYGQEPEARLLAQIVSKLEYRSAIDVGAERGAFVDALLNGGAHEVYAVEPEPTNVMFLRQRFGGDPRVTVHDCAVSSADGELTLHLSSDPDGAALSFGHTVLERPDTDEISWHDVVAVNGRSLASMVQAGEIPQRVGILKIDTEGHDFAVISGMGNLDCDVIMAEHWLELPHSLGPCPWSIDNIVSTVSERGFSSFAFLSHRGELTILQWNDATVPEGSMGNLIFLHDRVLDRLLPTVLECASALAMNAVAIADTRARVAQERLGVIEDVRRERDIQAEAAAGRLAALEDVRRERDIQAEAAAERLAALEELERAEP
jgi:FkbM family methyltransferase